MRKILLIRLSSIGDIVLTSPVVRCIKKQLPDAELHFLVKKQFVPVVEANPHIDKIHIVDTENIKKTLTEMQTENFDFIVDLHKNFRSIYLTRKLKLPHATFNKLNIKKWMLVNLKIDLMPEIHIVDRYFEAVKELGIKNDGKGLDYFIPEKDRVNPSTLPDDFRQGYAGFVIGAKHVTKALPEEEVVFVINKIKKPVVLLGGPEDREKGERILAECKTTVYNACGKYNINASASLVEQADVIITNDTGLMHIAAAFKKEVISVWGNTVTQFGMYPYLPEWKKDKSHIFEVQGLNCRPCSKLGYKKCPRGHFKCMRKIDLSGIADVVNGITKHG
ncbi:MAG: glycosyltransferase family 9 protein [Bacteroidales bacterium]|nr:glycosyltransferase family 9 protein [Bacteroidales bacterium]MCF8387556.1 glycosyltransferase family 9 protein [Bacteroidales bacterium]MCF8399584.1 glycosyltransferase family 9 protein [Bacteroidales bacterium]